MKKNKIVSEEEGLGTFWEWILKTLQEWAKEPLLGKHSEGKANTR